MRRAVHVNHVEGFDLDPHSVHYQRVAFVAADGVPVPGWRQMRGVGLVQPNAADFVILTVKDRNPVGLLYDLNAKTREQVGHTAWPALVAWSRIALAP